MYSLAAGMYNAGKIMGTLGVAILTNFLGFKIMFSSGVLLQMIGFLVYGLSSNGWTIILSRALVGYNSGIIIALPFAYFGKSIKEYCKVVGVTKKKGQRLKNKLVYLSGFITTSNCVITLSKIHVLNVLYVHSPAVIRMYMYICISICVSVCICIPSVVDLFPIDSL